MAPSAKKKKAAIKRRKKRASAANIQPSSPTNSQHHQQGDSEDDDLKTHDEEKTTNGDINIETSTNQSHFQVETEKKKEKVSYFIEGSVVNSVLTRKEMAEESGKVHIEFPKKSDKGGSSSSSSSSDSSDDESNVVKKVEGKIESSKKKILEEFKKIKPSKKKVLEDFKGGMAGISNAFAGMLPSKDKVEKVVSSSEDSVEKIVSSVEEKIEGSGSISEFKNETGGLLQSEDSVEKIVSSVEAKIEGSGSILPASVPPSVDTSKAPETPDSPEKEALLPIVPVTVQPASWKNCCGLFEVLTGSNR